MSRLHLGFAVLWAVMLHVLGVLWWLLEPLPEPLAESAPPPSLPILEVALLAPPTDQPASDESPPELSVSVPEVAVPEPSGVSAPLTASNAARAEHQQQWEYEQRLRAYLAARANLAARDALVGQAQLRFSVQTDGVLRSVQVLQADSPAVAEAAVALLRGAAPLPRPPRQLQLQVPVQFRG